MAREPWPQTCEYCRDQFYNRRRRRFCSRRCARRSQPRPPPEERFWAKVKKTTGCWLWAGAINSSGYGSFAPAGRIVNSARYSWELHFGPIPRELHVLHRCDVRACVRPDHLFLGTNAQNVADRDAKGRVQHGERHVRARLTAPEVRAIRLAFSGGATQPQLARVYGVTHACISNVVRGVNWKHLD
jgi:hypothetical protein